MAFENKWDAIPARILIADGGIQGQISLESTRGLYSGHKVILKATGQDGKQVEVLRVLNETDLIVNVSVVEYTLAGNATLEALEQPKATNSKQESENAVYAREPIVAKRVIPVDELGNYYNDDNPLPTTNQDAKDSVVKNFYDEVASVPTASPVTVTSYTVPPGVIAFLQRVEASGGNVATYEVLVNNNKEAKRRTYFGADLTTEFNFDGSPVGRGLPLVEGDVVILRATHNRPDVCDFEGRIQVIEIEAP